MRSYSVRGPESTFSPPDNGFRSCNRYIELVRRCLISWDYEASGIWLLPSDPGACEPSLGRLLSPALHDDLKRWNDWGSQLFNGRVIEPDEEQVARWRVMELDLAERAQDELGEDWEVLYADAGALTWVRRPSTALSVAPHAHPLSTRKAPGRMRP